MGDFEVEQPKRFHILQSTMSTKKIDPTLSAIASLMGKRGGKVKTPAKIKAAKINVRKALAARGIKLQPS